MGIFEVRARDTFMGLISSQRLGHISLKSNSRRRVKNVKSEMNDVNYLYVSVGLTCKNSKNYSEV